jgi:hypothetical protein
LQVTTNKVEGNFVESTFQNSKKKKKRSENIKAIIVEITVNLLLQKRISIINSHHESEMDTKEREREREREMHLCL